MNAVALCLRTCLYAAHSLRAPLLGVSQTTACLVPPWHARDSRRDSRCVRRR